MIDRHGADNYIENVSWLTIIMVKLHPHAQERLVERGATEEEVISVEAGEAFPAKYGRSGFRRNFSFDGTWRSKRYTMKQVEVYAVKENTDWLVITVVTRDF